MNAISEPILKNIYRGFFFGLITIDLQFLIDKFPVENSKTKAKKFHMATGGPATNAAIAYSFLGGTSILYSPVGKHYLTSIINYEMKNYSVQLCDLSPENQNEPVFASILTSENNGQRTVFSYNPATPENLLIPDINNEKGILLVDGFYLDACIDFIKKNKTSFSTIVLDGGSWKSGLEKLLPYIDVAICSANFLPPRIKKKDVCNFLLTNGISKIAITNGEKPIEYCYNRINEKIPVEKIDAVDTLAAGDFFHGAFCYYFQQTQDFESTLHKASKIAARSCESFGTREWMNCP